MKLILATFLSCLTLIASAAPHRVRPRRHRPAKTIEVVRKVPWQTVAAEGVAAGTVIAAYKISDGVEDGLKTVAQEKPEAFTDSLSVLTWPLRWAVLIALLCSGYFIWRRIKTWALRKNGLK
ncbi:MAG: hypothetical protein IJC27_06430 [Lentisphaeria bacterium]|nr:hypothetical protein [Lentisphaeria bacterium]